MSNISGVQGNVSLLKETYKKMVSMGESAIGQDFIMTVDGYPDLQYLIQSFGIPALKRESIETYGPHGVKFVQQGKYEGAVEIPITFKEAVAGNAYQALKSWVKNKQYLDVTLTLVSESNSVGNDAHEWEIEDAWIELDNADLSVEDAVPIKPSGTLHGIYYPE
ncbi:hypothetical protein [Desulfatirhabdium butyrativorans]|uniref:hypothetical protein n=1 Tax=Desulfatirhabdium butyrativorans TaxID=340467 RepID=UPI00041DA226|nr:hypothetical protein [Desulfatirhabdium butyrativorans]